MTQRTIWKAAAAAATMSLGIASFALAAPPAAAPAEAKPATAPSPVVIPGTQQIDFVSKLNGRTYRLFIATPPQPPPKEGFPVLYVLDGGSNFGTAVDTARLQSYSPGMRPSVVVGIGYPTSDRMQIEKLRSFDLSLPATKASLAMMPSMTETDFGGVDAFLDVIETEIKPRAAAVAPVNPAEASIFGHSLGGLAVLRALFERPGSYRAFIASSPSIFWSEGAILAGEAGFIRTVSEGKAAPRVLITVGGEESNLWTTLPPGNPFSLDQINGMVRSARMVDNARDLADRLAAVKGPPGYKATGIVFPGETHLSEPPVVLSRAVRFSLGVP